MVLTKENAISILRGDEKLYSIEDISSKLSIPKSTLNRWRKASVTTKIHANKNTELQIEKLKKNLFSNNNKLLKKLDHRQNVSLEASSDEVYFPVPDLYLGQSPRWKESTLVKWMQEGSK